MVNLPNGNSGKPSLIPEPIRARLNDLAKKLESEHRSLEEANLLREAEVKGLQTELTRRESSLKNELSQLKGELTQKGSAQEEYKKKEQKWKETQTTWEAERKKWESFLQ